MRFSILLSCLVGFAMAHAALGACLQDDYTVKAEFPRSVAVVKVLVVSERNVPDPDAPEFIGGTIYRVKIQESFRGALQGIVEVFSENSSGRFPMERRREYLLFLYRDAGRLSADPCGNSGLVSEKKDVLATVRELRKEESKKKKPDPARPRAAGSARLSTCRRR